MEETMHCDCPQCCKNNVTGYIIKPAHFKHSVKQWDGIMGDNFLDSVGAAAVIAGKTLAGSGLALAASMANERIDFQFQCPSCGYRWIKSFEK